MLLEDGRLSHRSVSANHCRKQVEARLIGKHYGSAFLQRPFLREGHFFSFQCSMASSSRCSARRCGFCKESPNARTTRLTCAGWSLTPNSLGMSTATLSHVHTSPLNPCASAISDCFQPRSFNSKARKRLPSRQLVAWLDSVFSIVG